MGNDYAFYSTLSWDLCSWSTQYTLNSKELDKFLDKCCIIWDFYKSIHEKSMSWCPQYHQSRVPILLVITAFLRGASENSEKVELLSRDNIVILPICGKPRTECRVLSPTSCVQVPLCLPWSPMCPTGPGMHEVEGNLTISFSVLHSHIFMYIFQAA